MDVQMSSLFTNIAQVVGMIVGIAMGPIADRLHCRKWVVVGGYLIAAVVCAFCLWTPGADMVGPTIGIFLFGLVVGGVPTCTRAYIPQLVVNPKRTDIALSTMGFFMAFGKILGGYFVSPSIVAFGYQGTGMFILAPMVVVAAILVLIFVKSDGFIHKLREKEMQESRDLAEEKGTAV